MNNKLKSIIVGTVLFMILVAPAFVLAATPPGIPTPGTGALDTEQKIYDKAITWFKWGYGIILAIVVIYIVMGGIKYLTAGGDAEKATAARQNIIYGLIGLAIVVGVAVLINLAAGVMGVSTPGLPF